MAAARVIERGAVTRQSRGSSRSRSRSPMVFTASTVQTIASPGKSTTHHVSPGRSAASPMMLPQLAVGGCTPSPRNERPASSEITVASASVPATSSCGTSPGSTCLTNTRHSGVPEARDAST